MQTLFTVSMTPELKDRLKQRAQDEGLYPSVIIRRAIELYLKTSYHRHLLGHGMVEVNPQEEIS